MRSSEDGTSSSLIQMVCVTPLTSVVPRFSMALRTCNVSPGSTTSGSLKTVKAMPTYSSLHVKFGVERSV